MSSCWLRFSPGLVSVCCSILILPGYDDFDRFRKCRKTTWWTKINSFKRLCNFKENKMQKWEWVASITSNSLYKRESIQSRIGASRARKRLGRPWNKITKINKWAKSRVWKRKRQERVKKRIGWRKLNVGWVGREKTCFSRVIVEGFASTKIQIDLYIRDRLYRIYWWSKSRKKEQSSKTTI